MVDNTKILTLLYKFQYIYFEQCCTWPNPASGCSFHSEAFFTLMKLSQKDLHFRGLKRIGRGSDNGAGARALSRRIRRLNAVRISEHAQPFIKHFSSHSARSLAVSAAALYHGPWVLSVDCPSRAHTPAARNALMAQRNVDMEKMCVCSARTRPRPLNAGTFIF